MRTKHFVSLCGLLAIFYLACSCSTEEAAAQILGASSAAPVFISCKAVSGTEIDFEFSLPVKVASLRFSPAVEVESIDEGKIVRVRYSGDLAAGEKITADLLAEDSSGNTINVLVPLKTRNDRIPRLLINELHTEYDSGKSKAEFIELKMLEAGNLGAARIFAAGNNKAPLVYEFDPVEVAAGEYVVVHLRTLQETNRDEYGSSRGESSGGNSSDGARDFWASGNTKLLRKTDAVYVLNQDDEALDAALLAETPDPWWNKDYLVEAAELLHSMAAWKTAEGKTPAPEDAISTSNIRSSKTRSVSRDETAPDTDTHADWYVTASSCATPGKPNNPKRFQ